MVVDFTKNALSEDFYSVGILKRKEPNKILFRLHVHQDIGVISEMTPVVSIFDCDRVIETDANIVLVDNNGTKVTYEYTVSDDMIKRGNVDVALTFNGGIFRTQRFNITFGQQIIVTNVHSRSVPQSIAYVKGTVDALGAGSGRNAVLENLVHRNQPHKWATGVEIDFGDGTFGMRYQGIITQEAGKGISTVLSPTLNISNIELRDCGGYFEFNTAKHSIVIGRAMTSASGSTLAVTSSVYIDGAALRLNSFSSYARTDAAYDVWITYSKI